MRGALGLVREIEKVIVGKRDVIEKVLMTVLAGGHILLEDIPGVGKTTLALALSQALDLRCRRVQFTPDVMPSDIGGFSIFNKKTGAMEYQPGPIFCNLFLADEINRASSRTQAALLEAMEEGRVTVDGETRERPAPFVVIATQNPAGSAGTQLLPNSQLDRFMIRLSLGYPAHEDEIELLRRKQALEEAAQVAQVASREAVLALRRKAGEVFVKEEMLDYIVRLVGATRKSADIRQGASPRASLALMKLAQAGALLRGRDYILPEDVAAVFVDANVHRLILEPRAGRTAEAVLEQILASVPAPRIR